MLSVDDLKAFLLGDWAVDRLIVDRALAMTGRLQGQATFAPSVGGLLYTEGGTLTFGDHAGPAEQSYFYDFPEGDRRASVRFADGRAFHDLDLKRGEDRVSHACPPDFYQGMFTALSATTWRSEWTVSGPRKDYELTTTYTRCR